MEIYVKQVSIASKVIKLIIFLAVAGYTGWDEFSSMGTFKFSIIVISLMFGLAAYIGVNIFIFVRNYITWNIVFAVIIAILLWTLLILGSANLCRSVDWIPDETPFFLYLIIGIAMMVYDISEIVKYRKAKRNIQ